MRVFVIGDVEDMSFYRQVTRGLGVQEYLYKPLNREIVARTFLPALTGGGTAPARGGRIIAVTGVRGGVGATTLAVNLAAQLADQSRHHILLFDADLHAAAAALMLSATAGGGLRAALENPERVDVLFAERSSPAVTDRLRLLAAEEPLDRLITIREGAARHLTALLCNRYNFVVIDLPRFVSPLNHELREVAHLRILVMDPTLPSLRDALRHLSLPRGPQQASRPIVVLNRAGAPGALTAEQVVEGLGGNVDVVIPWLPKPLQAAATLGQPAVRRRGPFQAAIATWPTRSCRVGGSRARSRRGGLRRLAARMSDMRPRVRPAVRDRIRSDHPPVARRGVGPAPTPRARAAAAERRRGAAGRLPCPARSGDIAETTPDRLHADVERLIAEIADEKRIQLNGREQRQLAGELVDDMVGLGPLEPLLDDDSDHRHHGERPGPGVRRAARQAGAVAGAVPRHRRMSPTSPSASPPRSAAASTRAARWSMPGSPTARASTSSSRRWRSTAPASRSANSRAAASTSTRWSANGSATPQMAQGAGDRRRGAAQHHHLGRHRLRQDHADERDVADDRSRPSGSSPSRTRPNCSCSSRMWCGWRPGRPTWRAAARSPSATWCATRCVCGPTG